jgi:arsenate reductase-like glutaredoxin family protein
MSSGISTATAKGEGREGARRKIAIRVPGEGRRAKLFYGGALSSAVHRLPSPMEIQIFGISKSQATRAAQRFFAERRVKVHFVDLKERGMAKGELQRWVQKFGVTPLIDKTSKRYTELGLGVARLGDASWMEKLMDEPMLLQMPLVRWQHKVTIGEALAEWKLWIDSAKGA